jgi:hypothetical protein
LSAFWVAKTEGWGIKITTSWKRITQHGEEGDFRVFCYVVDSSSVTGTCWHLKGDGDDRGFGFDNTERKLCLP